MNEIIAQANRFYRQGNLTEALKKYRELAKDKEYMFLGNYASAFICDELDKTQAAVIHCVNAVNYYDGKDSTRYHKVCKLLLDSLQDGIDANGCKTLDEYFELVKHLSEIALKHAQEQEYIVFESTARAIEKMKKELNL